MGSLRFADAVLGWRPSAGAERAVAGAVVELEPVHAQRGFSSSPRR